eukprot:scaffold228874_cov50-Prasinocladus_malaysianus.AAC.1
MPRPDVAEQHRASRCTDLSCFHPFRLVLEAWDHLQRVLCARDLPGGSVANGEVNHQDIGTYEWDWHVVDGWLISGRPLRLSKSWPRV